MKPIFWHFLIAFLALLSTATLLHAQADTNVSLRLQLGAYRNPAMGKFDRVKLNELKGSIYTEDIGNGIKRVFIGDYNTPEAAEKALEKVKAMGYENAYIVAVDASKDNAVKQAPALTPAKTETTTSNNSSGAELIKEQKPRGHAVDTNAGGSTKPQETPSTTTPTNTPKAPEKANYFIQLGSYKQINFKSFGNVADLGELTAERVGDATKMTLGTYTSRRDAEQILAVVKQRGYAAAFIKTIPIAEK